MATIKELQSQIEKLDVSLSKLATKAEAVNAEMSSGNWGVTQIREMETALNKLNAQMSSKTTKKMKLVDEASLRDFDILNKQIGAVKTNLENLYSANTAMRGGGAAGANRTEADFVAIGTAIKNAETALKSFESRKYTQFNAQGYRKTGADSAAFGSVDVEGRLGALPTMPTYGDADMSSRLGQKSTTSAKELRAEIDRLSTAYASLSEKANKSKSTDEFSKMASRAKNVSVEIDILITKLLEMEGIASRAGVAGVKTGTNIPTGDARTVGATGSTLPPSPALTDAQKSKAAEAAAIEKIRKAWLDANEAHKAYVRTQGINDPDEAYQSTRLGGKGSPYDITTWKEKDAMGQTRILETRADRMGGFSNVPLQKKQQSFTQGIGKDIGDLLKWSIAIGAIYGPINAASEAITQLVENEARLADVSVKMSSGVAGSTKVFDDVYEASKRAGEEVSLIIDAFGAAYTAAGRISDPVDRYTASIGLLDDAMALSKLSTLDEASAIDTLTAALYQTAKAPVQGDTSSQTATKSLARGKDLIDEWILVSNSASVSVETLATGVAVLGDSAETAGLSVEQLNSMVAVLSEVSLTSGKETANVAKALIGNYQQESAVKELNRLGIAVVDTTGKTRQFLDVMKDVSALRTGGLLNDQDFGRLTLALGGGGIRRQKDVAAFIENMSRMDQLTKIQEAGAGGQTEVAMAKKLDTVQTSATKLQNSIVNLAQTMGTEGGLLDSFSMVLDTGAGVADVFDKIASAVGKVGPLLMAAGLSSILLGQGGLAGATNKLATNVTNPLMSRLGYGGIAPGMGLAATLTGQQSLFAGSKGYGGYGSGMNTAARMTTLPSMAAWAIPAAQNIAGGDYEEAGANVAGGIVGALVGGPVGALIGSAIAEAFVRTTLTYDKSFAGMFAGIVPTPEAEGDDNTKKPLSEEVKDAYRSLGDGDINKGSWKARMEQLFQVQKTVDASTPDVPDRLLLGFGRMVSTLFGGEAKPGEYGTTDAAMMALLKTKNPAEYKRQTALKAEAGILAPGEKTAQSQRQIDLSTPEQLSKLNAMQQSEMDKLKVGVISGDLKQADYAKRLAAISAFSTTATGWMAAAKDESGKLNESFDSTADAWQNFLEIMSSGNQEAIANINAIVTEMSNLENLINNWDSNTPVTFTIAGQTFTDVTDKSVAQTALKTGQDVFGATTTSAFDSARLAGLQARNVYGSNAIPTPTQDVSSVIEEAMRVQNRLYSDMTKEDYAIKMESFEKFYVLVEEGGKVFYRLVEAAGGKLDQAIFGEIFQKQQQEGKIKDTSGSMAGTGLDFTQLDITRAQLEKYVPRAQNLTKQLEGKGYKSNTEDVLIATSDNQITKQHVDMKILQYLLGQILDTEKKQLQGVWNLPEGASFWVPLQSMIGGKDEGKGGKGKLDPSIFAPDATATEGYDWSSSVKEAIEDKLPKWSATSKDPWELYGERKKETKPLTTNMDDYYLRHPGEKPGIKASDITHDYTSDYPSTGRDRISTQQRIEDARNRATTPGVDLITQLDNSIKGMFLPQQTQQVSGAGAAGSKTLQYEHLMREYQSPARDTAVAPIANKIDIRFSSTTQLTVDGRVLATIIKPYLASDLVNTNQSSGGVTRAYVI